MTEPRPLRLLLVEDDEATRAGLGALLGSAPGLAVVGAAADGERGLREALRLQPDAVVLDLEMPRMDGFTFLRLLMAQRPTPVIVVSSRVGKADVFKALELGALDFVAKPEAGAGLEALRDALLEKCATVRALRMENLAAARPGPDRPVRAEAPRVIVIGASTGGPQALAQLLAALPGDLPAGVLVAQHMPEKFTRTFADRLSRTSPLTVQEAGDGDLLVAGRVLVAPGGHHLELRREVGGEGALCAAVVDDEPGPGPRYVPSVDRLLRSAAALLGPRACGVLLTGMGQDGREGLLALRRAGGLTLAESAETAVIYGMPQAAVASGAVGEVLPLGELPARLVRFARGG